MCRRPSGYTLALWGLWRSSGRAARGQAYLFQPARVECDCRTFFDMSYRTVPPSLSSIAVVDDVLYEVLRCYLPDVPTPSLDPAVAMESVEQVIDLWVLSSGE